MTVKKLFILKLKNGVDIFSCDKHEIKKIINNNYKDYELFREYDDKRINNLLYNNFKLQNYPEIIEFQSIDMEKYYIDFIEEYRKSIENINYKPGIVEKKVVTFMMQLYSQERLLRKIGFKNDKEFLHEQLRKGLE